MTRFYQLALLAFPRQHRDRYAAEMLEAFTQELAARDGFARFSFALAACLNALSAGVVERRRHRLFHIGPVVSRLDVALAWRMLMRYPGLSIVSVLGMSVGITIAAGGFTLVSAVMGSTLPLPEGERIVSLVSVDTSTSSREGQLLYDLDAWRGLASIEDVSASRDIERNLLVEGRPPELVTVAEISASAFRVARVEAYRGRTLLPADERQGAPDVLVIGHDEWVRRFEADAAIVGRAVRLGPTTYTVVGVMPKGFALPTAHSFWIPRRVDAAAYAPRTGPDVTVFGRLAPGATRESAQAELEALSRRVADATPATHEHLRPLVLPYVDAFSEIDDPDDALAVYAIQIAMVLLLVLICVNVAILVYARTATRQGEIAVRGALGASRGRIVAQLFVEALMLASVAAALGIGLTATALHQIEAALLRLTGRWPFWISLELQPGTVICVVGLTLLAAAIVGVTPALKATGRDVHTRLQMMSSRGGGSMQMGRLWTTLIVVQVAFTIAVLPMAMYLASSALRPQPGGGYASAEFLHAAVSIDRTIASPTDQAEEALDTRFRAALLEMDRRLRDDPRVRDVSFSSAGPGHEPEAEIETDDVWTQTGVAEGSRADSGTRGTLVRVNRVTANFFSAFDVPVSIGRGLTASDASAEAAGVASGVLVSRALVEQVFNGANPLGRRIRYVGSNGTATSPNGERDRWYEVVGVVPDFPVPESFDDESEGRIYHAADAAELYPAHIQVRTNGGDPAALADPLRILSASIDPDVQLRDVSTLELAFQRTQGMMRLIGVTLVLVILSVVLLATAGIYSLMSFTVSRRRREIGIRAALGANRNRILLGIFSRVFAQLGAGAALGLVAAIGLAQLLEGAMIRQYRGVLLPLVALLVFTIGVLAAAGPARQGLRIQPIETLRED